MANQQTLTTTILINARTGNGFSQVGNTLTELGSIVNGLSQHLIEFGADSLNVYRDYEKSMKDAEVALSTTYGRNTRELAGHMSQLDEAATNWAATTIFHTNDVANAISEAAHAGWDYEQIMSGIPAAMQLAQAGGLDLSEAVNYIVKSTSAAGIEFEDLTHFTDLWTFAANSSASTIGEFGDAMLRMGSTMRFAANPEELMTLIAVTANAGSTGSQAGTLIRNSMMRLVAPTKKAREAMAELGATSEETAGLLEDETLAQANARLEAAGFSAYEDGKLKSVLDTYTDLYVALGAIAGGYEDIDKNQDAIQILSSIFPTRSIQEALTLLRGASEQYDGLYEKMANGAAEGYGQYAAETMINTLDGRIEIFQSKVERLKQLVGEELSGQASDFLSWAGELVDSLATMDEGKFSALVNGLEVIAGAGPALLTAGGALRLIGILLTPAGGIAAGAIALGAVAAAIHELEEANFESAFGYGKIDHAAISAALEQQAKAYEEASKQYHEYIGVLDECAAKYQETSETFSSSLFTSMITGATLTDTDKETLRGLAKDMRNAVVEGLQSETDASISYWEMFFGGSESAGENGTFQEISGIISGAGEEAVSEAKKTGQKIRDALIAAFEDRQISDKEYQKIVGYMQDYNAAIARAQAESAEREARIEMETKLRKLQGASWDELKKGVGEIQNARDETWEVQEDEYNREKSRLILDYNDKIAKGEAEEADRDAVIKALDRKHESDKYAHNAWYNDSIGRAYEGAIQQSGLGDAYGILKKASQNVIAGLITPEQAIKDYYASVDKDTRGALQRVLTSQMDAYGSYEGVNDLIKNAERNGDADTAMRAYGLYTMDQINSNFATNRLVTDFFGRDKVVSTNDGGYYEISQYQRENWEKTVGRPLEARRSAAQEQQPSLSEAEAAIGGVQVDVTANTQPMQEAVTAQAGQEVQIPVTANTQPMEADINASVDSGEHKVQLTPEMDPNAFFDLTPAQVLQVTPQLGSIESLLGDQYIPVQIIPQVDEASLPNLDPVPLPIEPHIEGKDPVAELQNQGVQVEVAGNTESLTATIDAADGQTLLEYVSGDASNLEMSITDQDGRSLTENVHGNISALKSAIDSQNGRTITVNIRGNKMFASGGRATSASIFGEAGPEWAIPEEHTQRTAELLNAARAASGFSWEELLARYAGLNANTGAQQPTTIIYSPTINAANAAGVEEALIADKERLDRWWREKKLLDKVEIYS